MANDLRLQVIMDLANKASAPLRNISASSADAAKALKAARDQLKQLNAQQAAVDGFTKQQTAYKASSDKLKVLQQNLDVLRQTQGNHSKAVQAAEKALAKQTTEVDRQKNALLGLRARLNELGIGKVSDAQARLKTETAAATAAVEQQRAKLKQLTEQQKKLDDLKARHGKDMMHIGMLAGAGVGMQAAGRQGMNWALAPIQAFAEHEDAMVGVQRQVAGARDESGRLTAVYFEMERQIRELSSQIPVATTEIAKMFTAGARMEVPTDNLQEFVRMASEIAIAFDAVPDDITEAMGKVAKNFKIPITDIRSLADSINYLDDNAISKGGDIIDFMSRVAGTASMVKITAKETAALGSTLLTLGERRETASTAVNAVFSNLGAANTQTKKFRKMVTTLGLSTNQLEAGMQTDALGTIFKVMEAVRKLPKIAKAGGTSQIDAVAELFGKEHWDSFSKLLENRAEFERQIGLANSQQAQGSMGREAAARNQALSAQWQMFKNRSFNVSSAIGDTLKPSLLKLFNAINPVLAQISTFIEKHQVLVGWIMKSAIAVSAIVFALGTLAISLAAILGPLAMLKFMVAYLGLQFGTWVAYIAAATKGLAVLRVGLMALVVNPVVLGVILAIAVAALLIYKYWAPIKEFFIGFWQGLTAALAPLTDAFRAAFAIWAQILGPIGSLLLQLGGWIASVIAPIEATGGAAMSLGQKVGAAVGFVVRTMLEMPFRIAALPMEFMRFGVMLMDGLISGINSRLSAVKDTVVQAAGSISDWFKEKLGIQSPSRVFMDAGLNIGQGAAIGIERSLGLVRTASAGLAAATAIGMPGLALADTAPALPAIKAPAIQAPALEPLRLDTRPPLSAAGAAAPMAGTSNIQITINAAPGMDPQAIARAVSAELERRDRAQGARRRSSLSDIA